MYLTSFDVFWLIFLDVYKTFYYETFDEKISRNL